MHKWVVVLFMCMRILLFLSYVTNKVLLRARIYAYSNTSISESVLRMHKYMYCSTCKSTYAHIRILFFRFYLWTILNTCKCFDSMEMKCQTVSVRGVYQLDAMRTRSNRPQTNNHYAYCDTAWQKIYACNSLYGCYTYVCTCVHITYIYAYAFSALLECWLQRRMQIGWKVRSFDQLHVFEYVKSRWCLS